MEFEPKTLPAQLHHWAITDPETPAFVFVDVTRNRIVYTRAEVLKLSSRYAAILRRNGLEHGQLVCNTLPNSPHRLLTDLGIIMAGGVAMNGHLSTADGKDFIGSLKDAKCSAVILDPQEPKGAAQVLKHMEHTKHETLVDISELPAMKRIFEVYMKKDGQHQTLIDILNEEEESYVADIKPTDLACVWTTSGSTGFSKLVPKSHDGLLKFAEVFCHFVDSAPGDIYYNSRALGWAGGFPSLYIAHGITRVLLDLSKGVLDDMVDFEWEVMCQEHCTVAWLIPSQLLYAKDKSSVMEGKLQWKLRHIAISGQSMTKKHLKALGTLTDCIRVGYGITETGMLSVKVVTDKTTYDDCNNGIPFSSTQIRVVDKEMKDVSVGKMGEILVKTTNDIKGYLNNPQATERAFTADGWYRTGDVGYLNDKGEVFTVCRLAFSITHGPHVVYPGWLERRISRCPGVKDVMIVPIPDPIMQQDLCACIIPLPRAQLTPEGVKEYCKSLFLTEKLEMTLVPKYYVFLDTFPVTNTGKTCRRSLEILAKQQLGFGEGPYPAK